MNEHRNEYVTEESKTEVRSPCLLDLIWIYYICILMYVRITRVADRTTFEDVRKMPGIRKKAALLRAGLEPLMARSAARRLAALADAEPGLRSVSRHHAALYR